VNDSSDHDHSQAILFLWYEKSFYFLSRIQDKSSKDVITQLEPGLFKKVTGLDVNDFVLLVSIGVFNDSLMNDAVYKFK